MQCTLWGKLVVQLNEYYTTHKADGSIVLLLMNARIKDPQGMLCDYLLLYPTLSVVIYKYVNFQEIIL